MSDPEEDVPVEPELPWMSLRDGLPPVIEDLAALQAYADALSAGTGPVAIDAERASGYRYSSRAYLIQLRREGAGTALLDPICFDDLEPLRQALAGTEWILHAATQDLPCLGELGLVPDILFDTELAGRLLGYPRVALATLVESQLGVRLAKEHSAADWSTRPLPQPWLEYAALDVEMLLELRVALLAELEEAGKADWAREEFDALRSFQPAVRVDAWRRTSGLHKVHGRRELGVVRGLWTERDSLAAERDVTPSRIIPDSAIVAAALAMPTTRGALLSTKGFVGRGASRYARRWLEIITEVRELDDADLPPRTLRSDGPPTPRAWAEKSPVAARRLNLARIQLAELTERLDIPAENLLTPDHFRRVLWSPPRTREPVALRDAVAEQLAGLGARPWQIALVGPIVTDAILAADAPE